MKAISLRRNVFVANRECMDLGRRRRYTRVQKWGLRVQLELLDTSFWNLKMDSLHLWQNWETIPQIPHKRRIVNHVQKTPPEQLSGEDEGHGFEHCEAKRHQKSCLDNQTGMVFYYPYFDCDADIGMEAALKSLVSEDVGVLRSGKLLLKFHECI